MLEHLSGLKLLVSMLMKLTRGNKNYQLRKKEFDVCRCGFGGSHVQMSTTNVVGVDGGQDRSDEGAPIPTLGVKGLMSKSIHQIGKNPGSVSEMESGFLRRG